MNIRNKINYAASLLLCIAVLLVIWRINSFKTPNASEPQASRDISHKDRQPSVIGGRRPNISADGRPIHRPHIMDIIKTFIQSGDKIPQMEMSWAIKNFKKKASRSFKYKDEILAELTSDIKADQQERKLVIISALAQVWGAENSEKYANYLKSKGINNGPEVEGWLWSQLTTRAFKDGMLQKYGFVIDSEQMFNVLNQVAKEFPMAAMDALTEIPSDTFSQSRLKSMWIDYAVNARNSGDEALGSWLDAHRNEMDESVYQAIYKSLSGMNSLSAEELYLPSDSNRILELRNLGDYEAAGNLLVELKAKYGNAMDEKLTKELVFQWGMVAPAATFNWLNSNIESVANPEKLFAPIFRWWGVQDPEAASQAIDGLGVESLRASAMSNMIIAVAEDDPTKISVESINSMESDSVKARSIAGFILGASRHFGDAELEVAVKRQFLLNNFNLGDLNAALANSKLPTEVIARGSELLSSY